MTLPDPTRVFGPTGTQLSIPTPESPGGGQVVHPSVVHVPGGWNGYEYWMGVTGYKDGNDAFENPLIVCSHDGVRWVVPTGLTNPLDTQPGSPGAYNSDTDLTLVGSTMYLVWRTLDPAAVGAEETLYFRSSTDGVTWTSKVAFHVAATASRRLVSPAMLFENGAWTMFAVDLVGSPNRLVRLQGGANLTDGWADPITCSVGPVEAGKEPWHVEIIRTDDGYLGLLNDATLDDPGDNGLLLFMTSIDGFTWTTSGRTVIPQTKNGAHTALYRAALVPEVIGSVLGWRVWYSAWSVDVLPVWWVYRTWITAGQTTASGVTAEDVVDLISGSHRVLVEARVCTTFQSGPDPVGTEIEILSGDITYDATANLWSTLSMTTAGVDDDGVSLFPRFAGDLLAPYGNEIYIRYGIDVGSEVLWIPMGYYRIDDTDQDGASDDPIVLTCMDRMQGLIDARLIAPRQYPASTVVADAVFDLVVDVYPDAVVLWDDDSDQSTVGRDLIIEKDRFAALQDLGRSRGKVVYWDSEGVLRFETAPDPDNIAWEISQGRNGVLVSAKRRVTRDGMFNAVVARGEGTVDAPAIGIVVDTGPNSPTRWGGRFGKKPKFYNSPLVSDDASGVEAASAILRRLIGMPYSADFGTVVNPALRPRQAVRVTHKDGNRERHLVDSLRVPLAAGAAMTGSTREQTLVQLTSIRAGSVDA
jgi:hypothetical protein